MKKIIIAIAILTSCQSFYGQEVKTVVLDSAKTADIKNLQNKTATDPKIAANDAYSGNLIL